MKSVCCALLIICQFFCASLYSQYYFSNDNKQEPELLWELGASLGAMNCLTDIGGAKGTGQKFIKDINLNQTQVCGSVFAGATWHSWLGLRLTAGYGQITGNDNVLKEIPGIAKTRYLRNLNFKTSIIELAASTEIHLINIIAPNREAPLLSPYLVAGIGFFNYNPQARLNNVWINLRSLHTEGEGFAEYKDRAEYKPLSWCAPLGAGIKYDASGLLVFRLEIIYRFTGTDYLDDVSTSYIDPSLFSKYLSPAQALLAAQLYDRSAELTPGAKNNVNSIRGNSTNRDAFFSLHFAVSIALGRSVRK